MMKESIRKSKKKLYDCYTLFCILWTA